MTGSGGWPMSLFLTPDLKPIFAGTYFPPVFLTHGRPSFCTAPFKALLNFGAATRDQIIASSIEITSALQERMDVSDEQVHAVDIRSLLDTTFHHFEQTFDPIEGGFGGAPKFLSTRTIRFPL